MTAAVLCITYHLVDLSVTYEMLYQLQKLLEE